MSAPSCAVLHRLQAADHRLDARTHLLVLLQQRCTLGHHGVLPLAQGAILFVQLSDRAEQLVEPTLELLQLLLDGDLRSGFAHDGLDYAAAPPCGQTTPLTPVLT